MITRYFQGSMSKEIRLSLCISVTSTARWRPATSSRRCWPSAPPGPGKRPWRWWLASPRWTQTPSASTSPLSSSGWGWRTRRTESPWAGSTQMTRSCANPRSNIQEYQMVDTKLFAQILFSYLLFPVFSLLRTCNRVTSRLYKYITWNINKWIVRKCRWRLIKLGRGEESFSSK